MLAFIHHFYPKPHLYINVYALQWVVGCGGFTIHPLARGVCVEDEGYTLGYIFTVHLTVGWVGVYVSEV